MLRNNCVVVNLLLLVLLLQLCSNNRMHAFESNSSAVVEANDADDAVTVEAHTPPVTSVHRHVRQLFYEPNLIFVSSVGVSAVAEGGKCSTTLGQPGQCVRIDQCHAYYRMSATLTATAAAVMPPPPSPHQHIQKQQQQHNDTQQLTQQRQQQQLFYPNVQQWWQPQPQPQPQHPPSAFDSLTPFGNGNEICTFYDQLGRVNNGICCSFDGYGEFDFGAWPLPAPPTMGTVTPPTPPAEGEVELIEPVVDNSGVQRPVVGQEEGGQVAEVDGERDTEPVDDEQDNADIAPDFNVEQDNNIVYDPIKDDPDFEVSSSTYNGTTPPPALTPVTYHDVRYPWPQHQFIGQFGGVALPQWPPPLPTHPPSAASWPPPIPTHPPNHHYPTHPPAVTRPPTAITPQATKRPPSSGVGVTRPTTPTTTRRPASTITTTTRRPSYPSYPGFPPGFPTYPSYRPTYRPPVTSAPATTTTTTRRPATGGAGAGGSVGGGGGGTSAHGLPLQCGVRNPISPDQERIVGGTNASPYEFPWIAVLFKAGKQFCGGSLITHNHVLTAAHCVARMTSWDVAALTVHLGDYNIRTDFEVKHVERRVKRLVRHKGFDFSHLHNDIAILTLSEPVKFTYEIQPICLPTSSTQQSRSYSGHLATVAGWGSLRESGPQPAVLQKVDIPIWSNLDCARKYGHAAPGGIIDSMVCAGTLSKDSCSGDSGGPMIVRDDGGRYTQVGIVSWGIGCGKGQYPGVYTRVTALLSWIYKNIKM